MSQYLLFFQKLIRLSLKKLWRSTVDLLPIIGVVVFFQVLVLRQPFPDLQNVLIGLAFVIVGLTLFVEGLELGLFPIGESLAYSLSQKGSLFWLLLFAFALGFSTTIAEPALIAVAADAARVMSLEGVIQPESTNQFALHVRVAVALAGVVPGRNPAIDGFGLIAFASVFPISSVLMFAILMKFLKKNKS